MSGLTRIPVVFTSVLYLIQSFVLTAAFSHVDLQIWVAASHSVVARTDEKMQFNDVMNTEQ